MLNWTATQHSGEKKAFRESTFQNPLTVTTGNLSKTYSVSLWLSLQQNQVQNHCCNDWYFGTLVSLCLINTCSIPEYWNFWEKLLHLI